LKPESPAALAICELATAGRGTDPLADWLLGAAGSRDAAVAAVIVAELGCFAKASAVSWATAGCAE
jgi:hypothetical protein